PSLYTRCSESYAPRPRKPSRVKTPHLLPSGQKAALTCSGPMGKATQAKHQTKVAQTPDHSLYMPNLHRRADNRSVRKTWLPPKRRDTTPTFDIPRGCIDHLARNPRRTKIDPVCKTCIGNFLSARIDTLGAQNISTGCLEPVAQLLEPQLHLAVHARREPLNKFNMEMLEFWKQTADPKPMTCTAPDCNAVGLPDLRARYAAKHVNDKMSDTEKETLELMQSKDGRRCPHCQLVIVKDGGCDSMLCVGCYKYFNWATAASAVSGAKKAQVPLIHGIPYWIDPNPANACEMDGLLAGGNATKAATS
ncbi:hypothetical protein L13192_12721, partial [Pyrenophora tritici-repentis]